MIEKVELDSSFKDPSRFLRRHVFESLEFEPLT